MVVFSENLIGYFFLLLWGFQKYLSKTIIIVGRPTQIWNLRYQRHLKEKNRMREQRQIIVFY